jgi:hypothetical protein
VRKIRAVIPWARKEVGGGEKFWRKIMRLPPYVFVQNYFLSKTTGLELPVDFGQNFEVWKKPVVFFNHRFFQLLVDFGSLSPSLPSRNPGYVPGSMGRVVKKVTVWNMRRGRGSKKFLELVSHSIRYPIKREIFQKFFSSSGIDPFGGNFIRISHFWGLKIFPRIKKWLFIWHIFDKNHMPYVI